MTSKIVISAQNESLLVFNMNNAIEKAILICGTQAKLANRCNVSQQAVNLWLKGGKMDVGYIPPILIATDFNVNPTELRADVDWPTIYESLKRVFGDCK